MARGLKDWVEHLLQVPGEKLDLSNIALYHPQLAEAVGDVDMQRSFFWSGQLHGRPDILENIIQTQHYEVGPERVMPITGGTSMGIFLACTALLEPGDEVICESPGWQQVPELCELRGIKVHQWQLRPENRWKPDIGELEDLLCDKVKIVYINHPHNPTGSLITEEEMSEICRLTSKYGAYILSDEINRGLEWDGAPLSPAAVNHCERAISVASMSKSFGATGLRFGWFATRDKSLYDKCYNLYYNSLLCNNHPAEIIAGEMLKPEKYASLMNRSRETGEKNLAALSGMVENSDLWSWTPPGGSFSCLLAYHTGEPSWDFYERMVARRPLGLEFVPGSCFSPDCEHHLRIGFGSRPEHFKKALDLLHLGASEKLK